MQKFLFERDFNEGVSKATPQHLNAARSASGYMFISVDELDQKLQQAFEEGRAQAQHEFQTGTEKQLFFVLESLESQMAKTAEWMDQSMGNMAKDILDIVVFLVKNIIRQIPDQIWIDEISNLIKDQIQRLNDESKLLIRVHPDFQTRIQVEVAGIVKKISMKSQIEVLSDDQLSPPDCVIEWNQGAIERNVQSYLDHIQNKITAILGGSVDKASLSHDEDPNIGQEPEHKQDSTIPDGNGE